MPLVWAHAEHAKLARSIADGCIFDAPTQTHQRYVVDRVRSRMAIWRHDRRTSRVRRGDTLRIEAPAPIAVRWSDDDWATAHETTSRDTRLGRHIVDLPTDSANTIVFTLRWVTENRWEQIDYRVGVQALPQPESA
jgi:glucoamylase